MVLWSKKLNTVSQNNSSTALAGLRVLDMSRILAGPWSTQVLADLGAEVIKVERPGTGDDTRHWGPPNLCDNAGRDTGEAAYYHCANRGKHSVCLDISSTAGQQAIKDLALQSDILIENYKCGDLKRYGLDFESLQTLNPRLIYCSISGFGQSGPLREQPGYDFLIQAMGGLMSVTGEADGSPQKVGVALSDIMTGLYATIGILAAVNERHHSGLGQYIDLSLLDVTVAALANQASNFLIGGVTPQRMGNAHPNIVPYQSFATLDGHIILAIGNDGQFQRFCALAGCADLAHDSRFCSNPQRVANRQALLAILAPLIATRSSQNWLNDCAANTVPAGPINSVAQVFEQEQVVARGMRVDLAHPQADSLALVANPIKLSRTPARYEKPAPALDQDRDYVLRSILNYNDAQIEQLSR